MAEETEQVTAVQIPVVAKSKKGRGPTVARWQIATIVGDSGVLVQQEKYISPEAALKAVDGDTFQNMQQRCVLALLADKPEDALKWAKRAFGEANNPPHVKTATDLIARALKAQDGNVGRANAWITSNTPKKPEKP